MSEIQHLNSGLKYHYLHSIFNFVYSATWLPEDLLSVLQLQVFTPLLQHCYYVFKSRSVIGESLNIENTKRNELYKGSGSLHFKTYFARYP